jgi:hypothetical protein
MRKYYPGITIFKLAGALLVLVAHIMLLRYLELIPGQRLVQFTALATRVVVPGFYVIAGFLAYKGWTHAASSRDYMGRYFKRLFFIYCFFCFIFAAQHIVPSLVNEGLSAGNLLMQAKIMFMAFFLNGPFIQFWFIPPLVFGLLIAYVLFRTEQMKLAVGLALGGFVGIQFVSGSLSRIMGSEATNLPAVDPVYLEYASTFATRYIGFGLTFVIAGAFLAKYEEHLMQIKVKPLVMAAIVLTAVETLLLFGFSDWSREYKLSFSMLPNTLLLFYGILRIKGSAVQKYHKIISLFSIVTFFGHVLFIHINSLLFGWSSESMSVGQDFILLLVTLLECAAVTALLRSGARYRIIKQLKGYSSS